jgi:hypothetical protein
MFKEIKMLLTFEQTSALINENKTLHIAATENLLRKLPKGNWIGGSTEYFVGENGGVVTDSMLSVIELEAESCKVNVYDKGGIKNVAADTDENGYSLIIIPFNSEVHTEYADNAPSYEEMFFKPVVGWISGLNLSKSDQTPIAVDGTTGTAYADKAVAFSVTLPAGKTCSMNIINIFEQDDSSPVITFPENGFSAEKCCVDGKEIVFADYIAANSVDTKLPLVGDYSGMGVNVSVKNIAEGKTDFYAPVFSGIEYRFAKPVSDYETAFRSRIDAIEDKSSAFACNCILNFLYGNLEGKKLDGFYGAITFGEIAWQLLNQTLVYLTVE